MKITITFDPRDVPQGNRDYIEAAVLMTVEVPSAVWSTSPDGKSVVLTYTTTQEASDVIHAWENEDFWVHEFQSFTFSR